MSARAYASMRMLRRAEYLRLAVVGSSARVRPSRHIGGMFPVFTAAAALVSIALLSGCAASGGIGIANSALTGALAGIAPTLSVEQILENAALYHNLRVQLDMIEGMGIVTTTTQTPVVVTGTPLTPTPVTVTPPVIKPIPIPPPSTPPTSPPANLP